MIAWLPAPRPSCPQHVRSYNSTSTFHPFLTLAFLWRPPKFLPVHSNSLLYSHCAARFNRLLIPGPLCCRHCAAAQPAMFLIECKTTAKQVNTGQTRQYRIESKTELRAGSTTAASWRAALRSAGASASSCSSACINWVARGVGGNGCEQGEAFAAAAVHLSRSCCLCSTHRANPRTTQPHQQRCVSGLLAAQHPDEGCEAQPPAAHREQTAAGLRLPHTTLMRHV